MNDEFTKKSTCQPPHDPGCPAIAWDVSEMQPCLCTRGGCPQCREPLVQSVQFDNRLWCNKCKTYLGEPNAQEVKADAVWPAVRSSSGFSIQPQVQPEDRRPQTEGEKARAQVRLLKKPIIARMMGMPHVNDRLWRVSMPAGRTGFFTDYNWEVTGFTEELGEWLRYGENAYYWGSEFDRMGYTVEQQVGDGWEGI